MNVSLPDGTVLRDVPDGTTKAQLRAKLAANGYDVSKLDSAPAAPAAPAEVSWGQRGDEAAQGFRGGVDDAALGIKGLLPQGVQDFGDRLGETLGMRKLTKETATPIPDTWAGTAGAIGANVALTAAP